MKTRTVLPGLLALVVLVSACSSDSKASTTSAAAATATSAPATAAPTTVASAPASAPASDAPATSVAASGDLPMMAAVGIAQFKYGPAETHVAVGGTVTWTNNDNQKHTATDSGAFDTGAIEGGAGTASATFDTAGTFAYICSFHPFMKGTVIVGS